MLMPLTRTIASIDTAVIIATGCLHFSSNSLADIKEGSGRVVVAVVVVAPIIK